MTPVAYLNGRIVDADEARLAVTDAGFLLGITLSEQLRTFGGRVFQLDAHLHRLFHGVEYLEWSVADRRETLQQAIEHVVTHNWPLGSPQSDLGITVFVTPGTYPLYSAAATTTPTVCVHTYALPFHQWAAHYRHGVKLTAVSVRQVPAECWPPFLKCRSRMHYYLASREARQRAPGSVPLLLDEHLNVSETPTANVLAWFPKEGLVTPQEALPGISRQFVRQLATKLGMPMVERPLAITELSSAHEVMLTSTPYGILPVRAIDDAAFACPGDIYRQLLATWNESVGLDLAAQAVACAAPATDV